MQIFATGNNDTQPLKESGVYVTPETQISISDSTITANFTFNEETPTDVFYISNSSEFYVGDLEPIHFKIVIIKTPALSKVKAIYPKIKIILPIAKQQAIVRSSYHPFIPILESSLKICAVATTGTSSFKNNLRAIEILYLNTICTNPLKTFLGYHSNNYLSFTIDLPKAPVANILFCRPPTSSLA